MKNSIIELRYIGNKAGFIKEAKEWAVRNGKKTSKQITNRMYFHLQEIKNPIAYDFKHSYYLAIKELLK